VRRTTTTTTTTPTPSTTQSTREVEEEEQEEQHASPSTNVEFRSPREQSWNRQENQLEDDVDEEEEEEEEEGVTAPPPTEVAKGAYHEVNPGQYDELHPGQPVAEAVTPAVKLDVQVDVVKSTDHAKVYNVQSRVDEFIIGEYGTISTANGQTQHGVRYTAVADDDSGVDRDFIYETLLKYFPMSVKGVDPPTNAAEQQASS